MKDVVLSTNQAEMDYAIRRVNETEKEVRVQLSIVEDNILGQEGLNLVGTARRAFEDWKYIRNEVIALMHCNNVSDAVAITQGKGWLHVQTLENNMSALINYANSSATNMVSSSHEINTVLFVGVSFLSVVMMVIDIALFVTMVRAIVRGLSALGSSILKESEKGSVGYVEITEPIKKLSDVAVIACEYNKVVQMVHRQIWVKDGIGLLNNEMEVIFRGTHKLSVLVRESLIRMSDHLNMHTCAAYLHEIPERLATSVPSMVTLLTHKRGKYAHLHRAHPRPPASESQQESPDSDNTPPESAANRPPSARQNSSTLCRIPDLRLDSCVVCRRSEVFGIRAASTVFPTRMCEDSHFRPEASISDPVYAHAPAPASASASSSVSGPMCASNPSQSALPDFTGAGRIEHFARARLGGRSGHFGLHGHGIDETYLLPQTGRTATTATTATAATTARSVTTQSVHVPSASDSFLFPNPPHHGPSPSPPRRAPPTLDDARVLMELSDDPMSDEGFEHEENPFPREEANLVYQEGCTPRTCIAGRCIGKQLNLAHRSNPAIAPPPLESEILNVLFARREPIVVVACGGEDLPENKCSKEQRRARHRMLRKQQQDLRTKSRPETPGPMPPTIDLLLTDHSLSPPSEQPSARSSSTHRKAPQAFEAFNLPPPAPPPVQAVPVVPAPDPVRTSPPHVPLLPIPDPDSPSVLRREIQAPWRVFGWGKHDPGYHLLAIPLLDTDLFFGTLVFTTPVHDDNVTLKCVREYTISAAQILTRFVRRHYSEEQMGHLVGYSREINNELLKANCELERRRREVEYAAMMKEQFLCHISHEIRTPLHGVTGLLALLLDGHHAGFTAEQTDLLRLAKDSSDGLLGVIGDVLDLAKIETGRLDLGPIPFEVRPGLRAIVEGFRIRACEKGIEIESEVDASVPEKVVGDKTRLDQVLINLIGNAVKFTSKGHVRVIVTTSPYVDDPENPPPRPVRLELSPVRSDSKDGEDADGGPSSGGGEEEEEEENDSAAQGDDDDEEEETKMQDDDEEEEEEERDEGKSGEEGSEDDEDDEDDEESEESDDDLDRASERKRKGREDRKQRRQDSRDGKRDPNDVSDNRTLFLRNLSYGSTPATIRAAFEPFGTVEAAYIVRDNTGQSRGTGFVRFASDRTAHRALQACQHSMNDKGIEIDGRIIDAAPAVSRNDAKKIKETGVKPVDKDKRNLYLAREGAIMIDSPAAAGMTPSDWARRNRCDMEKKMKLQKPGTFVSTTRLCIHNLPPQITESMLQEMFRKAAHTGVRQAKIVRDRTRVDAKGLGHSMGFGFVQFDQHNSALKALRSINNNPTALQHYLPKHEDLPPNRRLIVEFAIENKKKLERHKFVMGEGERGRARQQEKAEMQSRFEEKRRQQRQARRRWKRAREGDE
eukprot:gnl/Trimastix_PCT/1300.p1 GENE.gnl/Trimastix_PCT/1300~~gnl/Trimastix_PCT/1300.p1  ORF type:complete len:1485 (+),score=411.14 gnl/Trimastix_PCT/1300:243-4457(+)